MRALREGLRTAACVPMRSLEAVRDASVVSRVDLRAACPRTFQYVLHADHPVGCAVLMVAPHAVRGDRVVLETPARHAPKYGSATRRAGRADDAPPRARGRRERGGARRTCRRCGRRAVRPPRRRNAFLVACHHVTCHACTASHPDRCAVRAAVATPHASHSTLAARGTAAGGAAIRAARAARASSTTADVVAPAATERVVAGIRMLTVGRGSGTARSTRLSVMTTAGSSVEFLVPAETQPQLKSRESHLLRRLQKRYTLEVAEAVLKPLLTQTSPVRCALNWAVVNWSKQHNVLCSRTLRGR